MGKNFPLFDQGTLSAADYCKAATDNTNANLLKSSLGDTAGDDGGASQRPEK